MSDVGKYLKWMYVCTTTALLVVQFFFAPGMAVTPDYWQLFAATAAVAGVCCHVATLSHSNKLSVCGALAQHAGPLVRWSPFVAFALVVPTSAFLSASIGAAANGVYRIGHIGEIFHIGLFINPAFWFISMVVSLPIMGAGILLVSGTQGTLMGFATASRSHAAKMKIVPYDSGDTWEIHWEGERNGKESFALELREALARADAFGVMPRQLTSDSHLWAERTPQTVENVFRRILGKSDADVRVEDARAIGGIKGAVINWVYWAKHSRSRDSEPGAASRRVVVIFPDPGERPIPEGMS